MIYLGRLRVDPVPFPAVELAAARRSARVLVQLEAVRVEVRDSETELLVAAEAAVVCPWTFVVVLSICEAVVERRDHPPHLRRLRSLHPDAMAQEAELAIRELLWAAAEVVFV